MFLFNATSRDSIKAIKSIFLKIFVIKDVNGLNYTNTWTVSSVREALRKITMKKSRNKFRNSTLNMY